MGDPVTPCVRCAGEADSSEWEDSVGDPICNPCGRRIVDNHAAASAAERADRVAAEAERDYAIQEASKAREELRQTRQGLEAYIGAHDLRVEERNAERAARVAAEGECERLRVALRAAERIAIRYVGAKDDDGVDRGGCRPCCDTCDIYGDKVVYDPEPGTVTHAVTCPFHALLDSPDAGDDE